MSDCPGINWTSAVISSAPRSLQEIQQSTDTSSGCLVRLPHTYDAVCFVATAACLRLPLVVTLSFCSIADRRLLHCFGHEWFRLFELVACFSKRAGASVAVLWLVHCVGFLR